jgi:L-asparaginase
MSYRKVNINTALPEKPRARVMVIYTGGTFGMAHDTSGVLVPFDFSSLVEHLPALRNLFLDLTVVTFDDPIDSSNVEPSHWLTLGKIIEDHYDDQDGFVVLHGTDTMAYTASAMSFMLQHLSKPVVFTGAQLPISEPRSDARENLITSLEIASAKDHRHPLVPEVSVYFDYHLLRGCRARKVESMHFDAFESGNYPPLAEAGVKIEYNTSAIRSEHHGKKISLLTRFDPAVACLKLFPGIRPETVQSVLQIPGLKALILETYGSGNAPTASWFIGMLKDAVKRGTIILNISQCPGGMVIQGKYETSRTLAEMGVISGVDMTLEAAVTKLMLLLGEYGAEKTKTLIGKSMAGELTE